MPEFALRTTLPQYLRKEQETIESHARAFGLDMFPIDYEMLTYDQMNEVAAYTGFPQRYRHWRFGMEYEQLSKSYEYGASRIYEMVINNNPAVAYLLEGNSLTDQKLVMCHVCGHVDFFKNNFAFRATDMDQRGQVVQMQSAGSRYQPTRKWIDKMANHGARIARHIARHGVEKIETFVDACLSIENLVDPYDPFKARAPIVPDAEDQDPVEVPMIASKGYMESFINPDAYVAEQRKKLEDEREKSKQHPAQPERDVLRFLLDYAPLERYEHDCLEIVREEAYYFVPQMQTKIMNEGWASYWHSMLMTQKVATAGDIIDYAERNASVLAISPGQMNPYKIGVELYRYIEDRWNRGQFGSDWDACTDLEDKLHWDKKLGLGRQKIFEVRALYNDVTFLDEFLTPEFCVQSKLFSYQWNPRNDRYEVASREYQKIKEQLLFSLTNFGNPFIYVEDANFENRGELLLAHDHHGTDLRHDYAKEVLAGLVRIWKRPVILRTKQEGKVVFIKFDGKEHTTTKA